MTRLGPLVLLALCAAAACAPDPREALREEVKQLEAARIERSAVDQARGEADAAEAQLAERRREAEAVAAGLAAREAEAKRLTDEYAAETRRNERLRDEIRAGQERGRAASERGAELAAQVEKARARAAWAREQAQVLARELRPGDPDWATQRRLRALAEFAQRLAAEYSDDPTLASLAASLSASPAAGDGAARGAEVAGRIRDHLSAVYALEEAPDASASAAEPAPTPPVSTQ